MEIKNVKLSSDKIGKLLMKFAIPSIISFLIIELYNMVDTVFLGRYVGENAIAALTIAFPIQKLLFSIGMLVSVGTATVVAAEIGSKDKENVEKTIINAFALIIIFMIFGVVIIYLFRNQIITALGASKNVFHAADEYIRIILIGCIFQCVSMVACYIMTSFGYTKITLYSNILALSINTIMDVILVAIFGLGVQGAAMANVSSQVIAFIYTFLKFKKVKLKFDIKFLNISTLREIMAIGFTSFVIEISDALIAVILNELLATKGGDSAIIVVGIITKISMFIYVTIIGVSSAMQPIIAYNFGAEDFNKIKKVLKLTIKVVCGTSVISGSILMIFAKGIIGLFLKDMVMLNETVKAFRISIAVYPIMGIYYVCMYYYQAINESLKSFFLSIYGHIIVFVVALLILVNVFGVVGAWIAYPVSETIAFVTSVWFIRKAFMDNEDRVTICKYDKSKYAYGKV